MEVQETATKSRITLYRTKTYLCQPSLPPFTLIINELLHSFVEISPAPPTKQNYPRHLTISTSFPHNCQC